MNDDATAKQRLADIPTMSTVYLTYEDFCKKWNWTTSKLGRTDDPKITLFRRFIHNNARALGFLGISAEALYRDGCLNRPALRLTTAEYAGIVPICSPIDGTPAGSLATVGRYGENASDLIDLIGAELAPEFNPDLPVFCENSLPAPLFLLACRFIDSFIEARRLHWHKFENRLRTEYQPSGSTLWAEYALRTSTNPTEATRFVNKRNVLTVDHPEWLQLNYVLGLCVEMLSSPTAPAGTRMAYRSRIADLRRYLRNVDTLATSKIRIRQSDPRAIIRLKEIANRLLSQENTRHTAWRLDYNLFFERYVQYIMRQVARKVGASITCNPKISIATDFRPQWSLKYLEPDITLALGDTLWAIDVKYKSHLLNSAAENAAALKDTFRHDMHQVLAYAGMTANPVKQAALIYPSTTLQWHRQTLRFASTAANLSLVGIPIDRQQLPRTIDFLATRIAHQHK